MKQKRRRGAGEGDKGDPFVKCSSYSSAPFEYYFYFKNLCISQYTSYINFKNVSLPLKLHSCIYEKIVPLYALNLNSKQQNK